MIEKRYYNTRGLRDAVEVYERHYDMPSADFYAAHQADDPRVSHIPAHQRSIWASLWRELLEDEGDLASHVSRSLELA